MSRFDSSDEEDEGKGGSGSKGDKHGALQQQQQQQQVKDQHKQKQEREPQQQQVKGQQKQQREREPQQEKQGKQPPMTLFPAIPTPLPQQQQQGDGVAAMPLPNAAHPTAGMQWANTPAAPQTHSRHEQTTQASPGVQQTSEQQPALFSTHASNGVAFQVWVRFTFSFVQHLCQQ